VEGQQFVAVVFILFSTQGDFGGQAALQVDDQRVEAVNATPPFASLTSPLHGGGVTDITPSSEGVGEIGGWLTEGVEGQQFVAVVFILFPAQGDLSGQAALQVVDQRVEAVENGDEFFLQLLWRKSNSNIP